MSIKGAIKRLESTLAKSSSQSVTFIIPYCKDEHRLEKIHQELMKDTGFENKREALTVFVVDYATVTC